MAYPVPRQDTISAQYNGEMLLLMIMGVSCMRRAPTSGLTVD
jgi:hypothetical protein